MVSLGKQSKALAKDILIYIGKMQHWVRVKVLGDSEASQKTKYIGTQPRKLLNHPSQRNQNLSIKTFTRRYIWYGW